eukprot:scaffold4139_cov71-Cylindrotheca_fusiformis.AAC.1
MHTDTATTSAHIQVLLRLRIQEIYAQRETIPEFERDKIFGSLTLDRCMEWSPNKQKEWLSSIGPLMRKARKHANQPPAGNRDIRSFLTPSTQRQGTFTGRPPG